VPQFLDFLKDKKRDVGEVREICWTISNLCEGTADQVKKIVSCHVLEVYGWCL
jgi:hypothetical protein